MAIPLRIVPKEPQAQEVQAVTITARRRTPPQKLIQQSLKRFNLGIWGRQSGKTTTGLDKMGTKPFLGREFGKYWYVLQTRSAAKIAFQRFKELFYKSPELLDEEPNHTELKFVMRGQRMIWFKSGKNFEDLRAETLDGVVIDELRQQHPDLWPKVIFPMLGRRKGWADLYTSANGFDHCYDLYERTKKDPNWGVFHAPSTEAWWWTPEEIAIAKAEMNENEFAQELMAEFRDLSAGRAYFAYGRHNQTDINPFVGIVGVKYSKHLPIILGMDFNLSPMSWHLGQFKDGHFHWSEEIHLERSNTPEAADALVLRLLSSGIPKEDLHVWIIGDATGKATQRTSNQTDYDIVFNRLKRAGIRYTNKTPDSNPSVKDRVNAVNNVLKSSDGTVRMTLDPEECPALHQDFTRVVWKSSEDYILSPGVKKELTHASDSVGYPVCVLAMLKSSKGVGTLRVIVR